MANTVYDGLERAKTTLKARRTMSRKTFVSDDDSSARGAELFQTLLPLTSMYSARSDVKISV